MSQVVEEALDALRSLGTVEDLRALARQGCAPPQRPRVNTHIHLPPNFSAFESVGHAIDLADRQDVRVLGVSNYYDYRVYGDFVSAARNVGIFPLFGLEIITLDDELVQKGVLVNDPGNPGKIYICGKGITRFAEMTPKAEELIGFIRKSDSGRIAEMIAKLNAVFTERGLPTQLTVDGVIDRVVSRHDCAREAVTLQERHVCQALQEYLFEKVNEADRPPVLESLFQSQPKSEPGNAVSIQNEIRSHLMKAGKPAFVPEQFLTPEQAFTLILQLGGVPCYPTLADGTDPITPFEAPVEELIQNIKLMGFHSAEFIPIRNKASVLSEYVKAMRKAGLVITAGTEHNTLSLIGIEPTCVGLEPIPDDVKEILWEGACVMAAHQFLTLHGECGFVDAKGNPNPAFDTVEERIVSFRGLGAAVIETYFRTSRNQGASA